MTKFQLFCRNMLLTVSALLCATQAYAAEAFGEDAKIYGYSTYPAGMNIVNADGSVELWKDNGYNSRGWIPMTSGWIVDGKMCGYATDGWDAFYVEFDWETGEILKSETMAPSACPNVATLNVSDGKIYGFLAKSGTYKFFVADKDDPMNTTEVAVLEKEQMCIGLTYNPTEGYVAGARYDGALVKVRADGSQDVLLNTGYTVLSSAAYAALAYCATDGLYYWNPTSPDYDYEMYVIDMELPSIVKVTTFPDKRFSFMLSVGESVDAEAPKAPEILSSEFVNGSADGKILVRMPAELESGDAISGEVAWTASIDNEAAKEGTAAAGAEVTVEFEGVATGNHTFAFAATVGEKTGKTVSTTVYVGFDTPKSPANVTLTDTKVSWDAVTAGVNGGYVNPEAVTYTVRLNDEQVGTTSETELALENLDNGELRRLVASVTATANELTSAPGLSNGLTAGSLSLPAYFQPTAEDFEFCQVIDGDGNGRCWTYDDAREAFFASYNLDGFVDDWLILPAVSLTAEQGCAISLKGCRFRNWYEDESIEVRAAMEPTAAALTEGISIIERTPLTTVTPTFEDLNGTFTPTESGKWYIAIHAVSAIDQAGLFVKEILIAENGVTLESPAEATDLVAEAAEDATLEATVTLTLPTKTVGGADIEEGTVVEAKVIAASEAKVSGAPGERVSATVATVQGLNRITVETALGELPGLKAYVEVYTGYAIPAAVTEITATVNEDMTSAEISWIAPTEGLDQGVINPEALTYNIYSRVSSSLGTYWELLEENINGTTYTFTPEQTQQDVYVIGVAAANVAGVNPEPVEVLAVLGTPHSLPMAETFDTPQTFYTYNYWVTYTPSEEYDTMWGVLPMEVLPFIDTTEWNVVLCGQGLHEGALGRCGFPVFSTKDHELVRLTAPFWTGDMATPDLRVTGIAYGMTEPVEVGTVTSNGGWNELSFMLPEELLDREWVSLFLEASFPEGTSQWVCMDGYSITPVSGIDEIDATDGNDIHVRGLSEAIEISANAGLAYSVYTVDGRAVATGTTAAATTTVAVAPGFYLIRVAGHTFHITVK